LQKMVWGFEAVSVHVYRKWPTKASKKCWECGAQRRLPSRRRAARACAVSLGILEFIPIKLSVAT